MSQPNPAEWIIHQPELRPATEWFDQQYWLDQGRLLGANSGRGSAWMVKSPQGKWMLRHYFRGGLPARLIRDKYLWNGLEKSRAVIEWRLLQRMHDEGLPVPRPIAARVRKKGWFYTADILMEYLPHEHTLARFLTTAQALKDNAHWARVGQAVAKLHEAGYFHADLNAHNILLSKNAVWLIDFDRGRYMGRQQKTEQPGWQKDNLSRLHRSLQKIVAELKSEKEAAATLQLSNQEAGLTATKAHQALTKGWQSLEKAYHQYRAKKLG